MTIIVTYLAPAPIKTVWYLITLLLYYRSKDEALWLAFFLVTVDGFMSFFGLYVVTLKPISGLPDIELTQFYILLSVIKAARGKSKTRVFYKNYLVILLFYLLFMIVLGQLSGMHGELKDYFRILKLTMPFLLFFSIPRLFDNFDAYKRFFGLIFFISVLAFLTQLFTLLTGLTPAGTLQLTEEQISEAGGFRGFYNIASILLGMFGSLFFLSVKGKTEFNVTYLFFVVFSAFGMALISATRGWIISFGLVIIVSFLITRSIRLKWRIGFVLVAGLLFFSGLSVRKIKEQVDFSTQRVLTLEAIAKGDLTAEGTLQRLDVRGPRVMNKFKESPFFGWGFSDVSRKFSDGHVGNQTILLTTGIFGFTLLIGFFIYFCYKLFRAYKYSSRLYLYKNGFLIFILFLVGWFFIHSSSGQHFGYMGIPAQIIPQVVFFSFGAFLYNEISRSKQQEAG